MFWTLFDCVNAKAPVDSRGAYLNPFTASTGVFPGSQRLLSINPFRALGDATGLPAANLQHQIGSTPGKFYKGRSQEKTPSRRLEVFLLPSPLD
jgi:hypothetical protein